MKPLKIASYLALFTAVVLLGDRVLSFAAKYIIRHSRNQFARMYEGNYPADIVFLGDSRVDRNIDFKKLQELTGKRCLNLGLGGNSVLISEVLLKDFVQRYGNPELVVIELSHTTTSPETMGEVGIFSYCSPNMANLVKIVDPTYSKFESVFTSLRFNNPAFWRLAAEVKSNPSSRLLSNTIPPAIIKNWQDGHHIERPIMEKNMAALKRICDYADSRGIQIRLILGPCWKEFRRGISNYDLWKATMQRSAGHHVIHDYGEVFFEHDEYFNDEMHLNSVGAGHFVQKLLDDKLL